MRAVAVFVFLFALVSTGLAWSRTASQSTSVLLGDIKTLTLHRHEKTTGRRHAPVEQLDCVGGNAHHYPANFHPRTMQCYNMGSDGSSIQWKCEAELDPRVKLGNVEISCEGYDHKDDPYVLKGSCGARYELLETQQSVPPQDFYVEYKTTASTEDYFVVVSVVWLLLVILFLSFVCKFLPQGGPYYPSPPPVYYPSYWWGGYYRSYPSANFYVHTPAPGYHHQSFTSTRSPLSSSSSSRTSTGFGGTSNR